MNLTLFSETYMRIITKLQGKEISLYTFETQYMLYNFGFHYACFH